MTKTIKINGIQRTVTNTLSCGPGEQPHAYELRGGQYAYEIAGVWYLQQPGCYPVAVTVEVVP